MEQGRFTGFGKQACLGTEEKGIFLGTEEKGIFLRHRGEGYFSYGFFLPSRLTLQSRFICKTTRHVCFDMRSDMCSGTQIYAWICGESCTETLRHVLECVV